MESNRKILQLKVNEKIAPVVEQIAEFIDSMIDPEDLAGNLDDVLWLYAQAIARYPEDQAIYVNNDHEDNVWAVKELIRILRGGQVWTSSDVFEKNGDFADALRIMKKYLTDGSGRRWDKNIADSLTSSK